MRKAIAALLIALSFTLGMPAVGSAQAGRSAMLNGQIVDASGRGSAGRTVELISEGMVVGMTTSSADGHFSFAVGGAGSYIVRTIVNGHPAGIRVSVVRGQNPPMALLVLPTVATASPQIGVFISTAASALTSLGVQALAAVATTLATQVSENNDAEILADPQTKAEVAQLLQNIIVQLLPPGTQFVAGQPINVPGLSPELIQIVTAINQIIVNVPVAASLGG